MSVISLTTYELFTGSWDRTWTKYTIKKVKTVLKKEHTYVMIFSHSQKHFYDALMEIPKIKILYQSIPCVNIIHPGPPRIFAVVFELEDVDQPVPQLQS